MSIPDGFDPAGAWAVHAQVSIRPERFGALLYHFGTRRLSFLKDPMLLRVLEELPAAPDADTACERAGVTEAQLPSYRAALTTLANSQMIRRRTAA
ncbi:mycofactocin biosynthesis chaperone MftB [uncultured Jatrophihabitans sp.]|uniref:mycofactocin biosynthesis chaperone MftB n=1 Tax=uncultured Jatrophihabitans sp. TaxID=1610747 RepID=UPI0035CABF25